MTDEEKAVIEAAVKYADMVQAVHYGLVPPETFKKLQRALYDAVEALHNEHEGRWR